MIRHDEWVPPGVAPDAGMGVSLVREWYLRLPMAIQGPESVPPWVEPYGEMSVERAREGGRRRRSLRGDLGSRWGGGSLALQGLIGL